jgi:hypothetical protein
MIAFISKTIGRHLSDSAHLLSRRWEMCRDMMVLSARRGDGILSYGLLGTMTALAMSLEILYIAIKWTLLASSAFALAMMFLMWLSSLVMYPIWTISLSAAASLPFILGCVYCVRMTKTPSK